jgi:hypothetical protein
VLLGAIGSAFKYLFGRADRREARQEKREEAYVDKIEAKLAHFEERLGDLWTCVTVLATALHRRDPLDPALSRVAKILGDAFPIDLGTPPDMQAKLDELQ